MALSLAQKFVSLGTSPALAKEYANQIQVGVYNARRLSELGMVTPLAKYVTESLAIGTFVGRKAMELSMTEAVANLTLANLMWVPVETSLRSLYAANQGLATPHTLPAMASPPSVTVTSVTANPAGMGVTYTYVSGSLVPLYKGGADKAFSTNYRRFPVVTDPVGGGNVGGNESASVFFSGVRTTSAKVSFSTLSSTEKVRFRVRTPGGIDQYVNKAGTLNSSNGHIVLDFGSDADRIVTCEGMKNGGIRAINVLDGYTATKPVEEAGIALFLGDSFIEGVGTAFVGDGLAAPCAESLGFAHFWASGSGGTGYVATNSSTRPKLADRIVADITRAMGYGTVAKVFMAMGLNDIGLSGIQAEAEACLSLARGILPAASISVVGPWDNAAPSAPVANYAACKTAIQAAVVNRGGVHFLDPQGVSFAQNALTLPHPTEAGALTLGQWLAAAERAALA